MENFFDHFLSVFSSFHFAQIFYKFVKVVNIAQKWKIEITFRIVFFPREIGSELFLKAEHDSLSRIK